MKAWLLLSVGLAACGSDAQLGKPCTKDADCGGATCLPLSSGSACAQTCASVSDCPDGFRCAVPPGAASRSYCLAPGAGGVSIGVRSVPPNKIDILFLVDNSSGMDRKQQLLSQAMGAFATAIDDAAGKTPRDYHIGVVDSDLGAAQENFSNCHPGGDGGKLQTGLSTLGFCSPPMGANYVQYNQLGVMTSNLPGGTSLGQELACMVQLGANGCGYEHQLESVYRALHDPIPENAGFLRADAMLLVIFVTDEDDCSAPSDTDLFGQTNTQYGPPLSYRCTQYGVACNGAMLPGGDAGPLFNCAPLDQANGGKLFDVSRYIQFFTKPASQGGIKTDPSLVMLASLAGPVQPFSTLLADANGGSMPYQSCATPSPTCSTVLQHSCNSPVDSTVVANPAVRLGAVVNAAAGTIASVCDSEYQTALTSLIRALDQPGGCFPSPPTSPPSCTVADVSNLDGTAMTIPQCSGANQPCWRITTSACASGYSLTVDRAGASPPPNTTVSATCLVAAKT